MVSFICGLLCFFLGYLIGFREFKSKIEKLKAFSNVLRNDCDAYRRELRRLEVDLRYYTDS